MDFKKLIIISIYCTISIIVFASDILVSTDTVKYLSLHNDEYYYVINISITNHSSDNYYTWISFDEKTDSSKIEIKRYFYKRRGDLSLINLMTDNVFFIEPINVCPTIGATFLKKIHPNSTFTYKVLTNNLKECCYVDYIRIIKEDEILKLVPLSVDSSFYYQRDEIIIADVINNVQ